MILIRNSDQMEISGTILTEDKYLHTIKVNIRLTITLAHEMYALAMK